MTFLNPLALLGLIAAALPVIIHLLNLRKLKTIEFSTLNFLKELQQSKIRKLKLRQVLLLIIRTLIVIFIVLAFSRPALKGTIPGKVAQHAASTIILIFDDSFSMSAQDENGEYFKQAKDFALSVIDLANVGDEMFFLKLSEAENSEFSPISDKNILKQAIIESKISEVYQPIDNALGIAARLMSSSKNANKEIYLISDFQKSCFDLMSKNKTEIFGSDVKFFLVNIGEKEVPNTSVDSVDIKTKIFEIDKPVVINTDIKNFGNQNLTNLVASLYLNGVRSAQRSIDISSWSGNSVELVAVPKKFGFNTGYIEIESDAVDMDNRRYFSFYVPERISILIVSSKEENSKYIKLALSTNSLFQYREVISEKFFSENLANYDVIVILEFDKMTREKIISIKNFVDAGGGLIIFPDNDSDLRQFNDFITELGLKPADGFLKTAYPSSFTFYKVDFQHPIFSGVFIEDTKEGERTINSPLINLSLKLKPTENETPIITLGTGYPFLFEKRLGEGKILIFSVAANLNWSDFPIKGIFAPLIYRGINYAATSTLQNESKLTGENVQIKLLKKSFVTPRLKLIYPDGNEEIVKTTETEQKEVKSNILHIGKLKSSGIYELRDEKKTFSLISVNTNRLESDLRKISEDDLYEYFSKLGVMKNQLELLNSRTDIKAMILTSRYGAELWKLALIIVLILAFLEMLIALDRKKS